MCSSSYVVTAARLGDLGFRWRQWQLLAWVRGGSTGGSAIGGARRGPNETPMRSHKGGGLGVGAGRGRSSRRALRNSWRKVSITARHGRTKISHGRWRTNIWLEHAATRNGPRRSRARERRRPQLALHPAAATTSQPWVRGHPPPTTSHHYGDPRFRRPLRDGGVEILASVVPNGLGPSGSGASLSGRVSYWWRWTISAPASHGPARERGGTRRGSGREQ